MYNLRDSDILHSVCRTIEKLIVPELSPWLQLQAKGCTQLLDAVDQRMRVKEWVYGTEIPALRDMLAEILKSLEAIDDSYQGYDVSFLKRKIAVALKEDWHPLKDQNLEDVSMRLNDVLELAIFTLGKAEAESSGAFLEGIKEIRRKIRRFLAFLFEVKRPLEYNQALDRLHKHNVKE